jgi:uncharacterized membrane protein (UPF0127 family)
MTKSHKNSLNIKRIGGILLMVLPFFALLAFVWQALASHNLEIHSNGKTHKFTVETAMTPEEQAQGLMFRTTLDKDKGMLFYFESPRPMQMWMKNTLISLDMLFIDSTGNIVHIAENAVPESTEIIHSPVPVTAVLELAGGASSALGIKTGDKVKHHLLGN